MGIVPPNVNIQAQELQIGSITANSQVNSLVHNIIDVEERTEVLNNEILNMKLAIFCILAVFFLNHLTHWMSPLVILVLIAVIILSFSFINIYNYVYLIYG